MNVDPNGTSAQVNATALYYSLFHRKGYLWQSGRYKPKRKFEQGNSIKSIWNNFLFVNETVLNMLELNVGSYHLSALNVSSSGVTLLSLGANLLDGRMYFNKSEYVGVKIGSITLDLLEFCPANNIYTFIDAQASILTIGVYTENIDAEFLVGSIGAVLKYEDGKFTFGVSYGLGFRFSIKLW
ncbi:MAG: hypothetical protein E7382_05235 [Clostridiales bacterium]|nr:hypothetical protein [Clostridiales bacterium]